MSYQVLARSWRPQRFEEVVGQDMVTRTLQNAILSDRIAHAFLFSGVRGVGKTSMARILAKALNCVEGPTAQPCGTCFPCQEIAVSSCVDVLEIDAASNNGVDSIRELRESVRYSPARDRFKVFIIDEVHMLSNSAFNALLKTLEEPPPRVKFILATTELHKIPITIVSRCQQFDFRPITFADILGRLQLICREEGIEISESSLRAIASAGQGSMRDAQSALDQIISFGGKQIRDEDVKTILGLVDERELIELTDALADRDRRALLSRLRELEEAGIEALVFCRKLVGHIRNLMICRVAGWDARLLQLSDAERDRLLAQSERFTELDLIRFYDLLSRTENELRWSAHPLVHLEMTLMKLVELSGLPALEEVLGRLEKGAVALPPETSGARTAPQPARPVAPAARADTAPREGNPRSARAAPAPAQRPSRNAAGPREKGHSEELKHILSTLQMEGNMRLYAALQSASSIRLEEKVLRIVFPASEVLHSSMIQDAEKAEHLRRLGGEIAGRELELVVEVEGAAAHEKADDPTDDPAVKEFMKRFPGKILVSRDVEE